MISFAGLMFAIAFMSFFIWLFSSAYNFALSGSRENLLNDNKSRFIFVGLAFAGICVCYWLLCQNRYIYHADYGGYWTFSFSMAKNLFSHRVIYVFKAIFNFVKSMLFSELNLLLPVIIAFPLKVFGYTFTRYVMVNYMFFFVPVCFILSSIIKNHISKYYTLLAVFMAFTFTPFYRAMLVGYIDVACLIPASLSLMLMRDYDALSLEKEQILRDTYISLLLLITILFRRYFVFYVIGYVSSLALLSLYYVFKNTGTTSKLKLFAKAVLNLAVIGSIALVIMLVLCGPILITRLGNTYSELYSGFDAPLAEKINRVIRMYGIFTLIMSATGITLSLITKRMRKYVIFCTVSAIVSSAAFFHVQAMGIHHVYIIAPQLFILSCVGVIQLLEVTDKNKVMKNAAFSLCVLIIFLGFVNCCFSSVASILSPVSGLFGSVHTPLRRNDIHEIKELVNYLNSITEKTEKKVYVIAGNNVTYDILNSANKPYELSSVNNLHYSGHFDLRDGYPVNFLNSDVVVATYPITLPFQKGREIVRFHNQEIMNPNSKIGRHFTKNERSFNLDDGVEVYIYEKQSEFEEADLHYIADYFTKLYPNHESMFADRILKPEMRKPESKQPLADKYGYHVTVLLGWFMRNGIITPEEFAGAFDRDVDEFRSMMKN